MTPSMDMVWKVYRNGNEDAGLRYTGKWGLAESGDAEKKINSWYLLEPGRYDVEVYANGEPVSSQQREVSDCDEML